MKRMISSAYEYWLEPPEDDSKEFSDVTCEIPIEINQLKITVDEDGSWDYENYDFAKEAIDTTRWYQCEEYEFDFRTDVNSLVEDFDDVIAPHIPAYAGEYLLSCKATLIYEISNVVGWVSNKGTSWDDPDEYEYDTEGIDVDLDVESSVVSDVVITTLR